MASMAAWEKSARDKRQDAAQKARGVKEGSKEDVAADKAAMRFQRLPVKGATPSRFGKGKGLPGMEKRAKK